MRAAQHRLVGYDSQTELEKFEIAIPPRVLRDVSSVIAFDDDDPDAVGCYQLTADQASRIAMMVEKPLPSGLEFFLEGFAA